MEVFSVQTIGYAILCGVIPPLIWLYFLLRESARSPEPGTLILMAFIAGMFAVPLAIPFESYALAHLANGLPVVISWAVIEETLKYAFAALVILWRKEVNDPIDLVIYMLTVALGFAALENTLFLITPFTHGDISGALITGNLRFVGSTLLHVVASSAIGFAMAFSYKQPKLVRTLAAALGLILAVTLHSLFNFFIITQNGSQTVLAFFVVWTGAVIFFALFEVLKYFRYRKLPANPC